MGLMKRLGLKDRESRIYFICLRNKGGFFIHEIAKQTRLARSTVDLNVRRLVQRGFLNRIMVGRRLRYMATTPETVLFRQKQLTDDLEQIVPLLTKLDGRKQETEVIYFEGVEGLRRVHDDNLLQTKFASSAKKHVFGFSSGADTIKLYPNIQKTYINKRVKNGVWFKAIAPYDSRGVREWKLKFMATASCSIQRGIPSAASSFAMMKSRNPCVASSLWSGRCYRMRLSSACSPPTRRPREGRRGRGMAETIDFVCGASSRCRRDCR